MLGITENAKKRSSLDEAVKKKETDSSKNFVRALFFFALIIFTADYVFKFDYLEILWYLVMIAALIQYWREVWLKEWFEQGYREWSK